jgi:hypothetical protein
MRVASARSVLRAAGTALLGILAGCAPHLPAATTIDNVVSLDQNWRPAEASWFHHASQGTATLPVPYDWFLALEQPQLTWGDPPLLSDSGYLSRFGFLPSPKSADNPHGLPVGFARDPEYVDPITKAPMVALGFTCAGCHTGQLEFRRTAMRVEGGPAVTDLGKFRKAIALSLLYTYYVPGRFGRFENRVLGPSHPKEAEEELKYRFNRIVDTIKAAIKSSNESDNEGFARLDAINRIGNLVFGAELDEKNSVPTTAPVNYPHLWDAPWLDWVQYNGSIHQPMIRNAGEALGVGAAVNLHAGPDQYASSVQVGTLFEIEQLIAGPRPFAGLRPPRWPENVFGSLDPKRVAHGADLYKQLCKGCHLPPVDSPEMAPESSAHWTPANAAGQRYIRVTMVDVDEVGTDPEQARSMKDRTVDTKELGMGVVPFGTALAAVVERAVTRWYDDRHPPVPPEERARMNGYRENLVRAEMQYKARPLDGVWATPPFLHNGSVPNLYLLLGPPAERPKTFYLGSREFDPVHVGYEYGKLDGGFEVDTRLLGNSNAGHEFRDGPPGKGRVGRALAEEERWALVEYLKTLGVPSADAPGH